MYTITKVISQSFVCAFSEDAQNIILRGDKIGYTKDSDTASRIYVIDDRIAYKKMQEIIKEIPIEYIEICDMLVDYAKDRYNIELGIGIYLCLAEHMCFAVERQKQNSVYKNTVVDILEKFYEEFYNLARYTSKLLEKKVHMSISKDETGFIALHIMNVYYNSDMNELIEMLNFINICMEQLMEYNIKIADNRLKEVKNLQMYLKEMAKRLFTSHKLMLDLDKRIYLGNIWSKEYRYARKVSNVAQEEYGKLLTKSDMYKLYRCLKYISQIEVI